MILLAGTLGCLAWWLLDQDRRLSAQRLAEGREAAADLAVASLENRLSGLEQELNRLVADTRSTPTPPSRGAVFVRIFQGSLDAWPHDGLVFYPDVPQTTEAPEALFDAAEALEFQKHDYAGAIAALREHVLSDDALIRAAALARVARCYRKAGRLKDAVRVSAQLRELGETPVAGMPATVAGILSALYTFQQQSDEPALMAAAKDLDNELNSGRRKLSPAVYRSVFEEVHRALGDANGIVSPRGALSEAVQWVWDQRKLQGSALGSGRQSLPTASGPVLLIWKTAPNTVVAFAADMGYLEAEWLAELKPRVEALHVELVLSDAEGLSVRKPAGAHPAIRLASSTALPWTVQVFSTGDEAAEFGSRRNLLVAGMGVLLALILTGAWFIGHAVSRELAVARLKTDFVSSVSHEFRTPLTTLCQLSELLKRGRVANDQDRRQYYELLHSESNRLRRLVEALLNFGRLESGKLQFNFEELDASELLRQSAEEFVEAQQGHRHRLELDTRDSSVVRADRETLRCVFWNLFENAVKYSPDCDTVWVNLKRSGSNVEIVVRDRGVGIPPAEHRMIFEKFVRGAAARESNVSGAGIGLAMARQIVRAHGGDITLESAPGQGSTFRVLLPALVGK